MAADLFRPGRTSMMRIVHTALRRDLDRARPAAATPITASGRRWGRTCGAMMDFQHRHHDPGRAPVSDGARGSSCAVALGALGEVLGPHLTPAKRSEMMPVVSVTITEQQWRDWDQACNVKPLGPRELAFTGHWIPDELGPGDQAIVAALVPPVPRWIIRHILVRGYRPCSGAGGCPSTPASGLPYPARRRCGPVLRRRRSGGFSRRSRSCTVTACVPPSEFRYCTQGRLLGDATEWHFTLEPDEGGTRIPSHRVRRLPVWAACRCGPTGCCGG